MKDQDLNEKIDSLLKDVNFLKGVIDSNNNTIKQLAAENEELKSKFNKYEIVNKNIADSYNYLFNILFLDHEIKSKGVLKNTQVLCQELLDFVVNVCQKFEIEYWIDYGNLIGAARHEGFIPWDDDIDLGMMRKDYEKFLEVIDSEIKLHGLENLIRVHNQIPENNIFFTQITIQPKKGQGLYAGLDIFPYDFINSYDNDITSNFDKLRKKYIIDRKNSVPHSHAIKEYFEKLNISFSKQKYIIPSLENARHTKGIYKFEILDTEKILPLSSIKFNNKEYSCPNDYEYHLNKIYGTFGEWRTIPKILHRHGRVSSLKKIKDVNVNYENYIKELNFANQTFNSNKQEYLLDYINLLYNYIIRENEITNEDKGILSDFNDNWKSNPEGSLIRYEKFSEINGISSKYRLRWKDSIKFGSIIELDLMQIDGSSSQILLYWIQDNNYINGFCLDQLNIPINKWTHLILIICLNGDVIISNKSNHIKLKNNLLTNKKYINFLFATAGDITRLYFKNFKIHEFEF